MAGLLSCGGADRRTPSKGRPERGFWPKRAPSACLDADPADPQASPYAVIPAAAVRAARASTRSQLACVDRLAEEFVEAGQQAGVALLGHRVDGHRHDRQP